MPPRVSVDAPWLEVDTTDGYRPGFSHILAFVTPATEPTSPGPCPDGKDAGMTPQRTIPPLEADERATLTAFLDFQRATLALKCDGLTEPQLKERAVPRWVITHMFEEYARHNGHADLLRERLDGSTGE